MEKNQRIEQLKDIFTLIYPDLVEKGNVKEERANEERKERVQTWLNDIVQTASQEENPWREQDKGRGDQLSLLPCFIHLLRECILNHQWAQVLSMLNCITHIPSGADWAIWKATMTALYTEPESNVSLIQEFFKHSYLLKECNVCDIALEFVQYLISQGLTQEASKVIQTANKGNPRNKREYQRELTQHCMTLLGGYQGMVFFMDWKAALTMQQQSLSSLSSSQMSQSFYNLMSSQGPSDEAVKNIAKRATLCLDAIVTKSGVWDIFLTKSVEIHEFYEDFGKAESLLRAYRDKNPDNPNAHRFLYEHLTRNSAHYDDMYVKEESIHCLKSLAKLDPANSLVLTLWQVLTDGEQHSEAVRYILDLLDYAVCQNSANGWHCLAKSLSSALSRKKSQAEKKTFLSALASCWSSRRDWWPEYHFAVSTVSGADQSSPPDLLMTSKVTVAAILMGKDCHFSTEARQMLNSSSLRQLNNTLSDLDWDTVREFMEQHSSPCTQVSETAVKENVSASFLCGEASIGSRKQKKARQSGSSSFSPESSDSGDGDCVLLGEKYTSDRVESDFSASSPAKSASSSRTRQKKKTKQGSGLTTGTSTVHPEPLDIRKSHVSVSGGEECVLLDGSLLCTNTVSSAFKNWKVSDYVSSMLEQETFEATSSTSTQIKKKKRRAEDIDDEHVVPVKRRRKEM